MYELNRGESVASEAAMRTELVSMVVPRISSLPVIRSWICMVHVLSVWSVRYHRALAPVRPLMHT